MHKVTINNEVFTVTKKYYAGGRIALILTDTDGMPYSTVTVNLPDVELGKNETHFDVNIPDAQNMFNELWKSRIFYVSDRFSKGKGFVDYPIIQVLI